MTNKPRDRDLTLSIRRNSDDPCDIEYELTGDLDFDNDGRPGFMVYIDIDAPNDLGAKFHHSDPLWVEPIDEDLCALNAKMGLQPCPFSPTYWGQFQLVGVINKDRTLLIRNKNEFQKRFAFTLRFQVAGCRRVFELDPIGNNQNGQQA